jgi:hypothetical protein
MATTEREGVFIWNHRQANLLVNNHKRYQSSLSNLIFVMILSEIKIFFFYVEEC